MNETPAPLELLRETQAIADRVIGEQEEVARQGDRPPELGDVYVLEATREYAVSWVLVSRDPADEELFLAIPMDGVYLVGSGDIALKQGAALGTQRMRCRFGAWIQDKHLDAQDRVASQGPVIIKKACQRWLDLGSGLAVGTTVQREADDESEYREWVDTALLPAHQILCRLKQKNRYKNQRRNFTLPTPNKRPFFTPLAAAAILVVIAGGLGGAQVWRQHLRIQALYTSGDILEKRYRTEIRQLEIDRDHLNANYKRALSATGEERKKTRTLREQIEKLDRRIKDMTKKLNVVNPVIAYIYPPQATERGKATLRLTPEASHVVLFLALPSNSTPSRYKLLLSDKTTNELLWSTGELVSGEQGEIRVGIPADKLRSTKLVMNLSKITNTEFSVEAVYDITVQK